MLEKARAIVLSQIKYSESSLILHLYTDLRGRTGLMVPGARGRSKGHRAAMFQPLNLLEIELYHKAGRDLHHAREIRLAHPYENIPFDPAKSAIALFLAEVLRKALREEESNMGLFEFLIHSFQYLDVATEGIANFHLHFLIHLTRYLGFLPNASLYAEKSWFDLRSGSFLPFEPEHRECLQPESTMLLQQMLGVSIDQISAIHLNRHQRNEMLEGMIRYYQSHLDGMPEIKSHEVLKALFDN